MMRGAAFALLVALLPALPAEAVGPADPIDAAMETCLAGAGGQSTAGMVACTATAIGAWDRRLNDVYQQAMRTLDPKSQELLRTSQRRWVAFREAERAALGGPWRQDAGTIAQVTTASAELGAIKERVEELRVYNGD
jgi:uncharacterized protein YecT (DUF1311 family)